MLRAEDKKNKIKNGSERDKARERHPTRSNEQELYVPISVLSRESSKPKHTYIRASLALRTSPDPLSSTHPPSTCLVLILLCLRKKEKRKESVAVVTFLSVRFGKGVFRRWLESSDCRVCFPFSPSLSSGLSSSSSAETVATLSHWDASRSRKRLVACLNK